MSEEVKRKCMYCGALASFSEKIGSVRFSACDESECNIELDRDMRDAQQEWDAYAQEEAARDNYDRYR